MGRTPNGNGSGKSWWRPAIAIVLGLVAAVVFGQLVGSTPSGDELSYTEFLEAVEDGQVAEVTIGPDGRITGERADEETFNTTAPTAVEDPELIETLRENDVEIRSDAPSDGNAFTLLLVNLLPFLLIGGFIWWMARRARGGSMGQLASIGQSKAKEIETERPDTTFDDVAGYESVKQEIEEVVDYLKDPSEYAKLGAHGPGGILLVGPPGTGKTLLAKAVAGEADVPFFSAAGSEFVEMIVGVGASRVRDLFEKARKKSPAIIFIDELDSIGRKRGGATTIGSNNEQEQTLNQLLAEMDGFDPREGIVVIAATNRPALLDEALTRPGRFDRQIEVPAPTQPERLEILQLHTAGMPLSDDVDLQKVARGTPGFSGAQLESLTNEAAFFAARGDRETITQEDIDAARDRVLLGQRQDTDILSESERQRVAVHEAGHAIVAATSPQTDPVEKITILPTRKALGVTEQLPLRERRLYSEGWLHSSLAVRMGGRMAEQLVLGEMSSGAANDLASATHLATKMVKDFGLSDEVGPVGYASKEEGGVVPGMQAKPFSPETQRAIDEEVRRLLSEAETRAGELLSEYRDALDQLVARLLEEETVDGSVVYELVDVEPPSHEDENSPNNSLRSVAMSPDEWDA